MSTGRLRPGGLPRGCRGVLVYRLLRQGYGSRPVTPKSVFDSRSRVGPDCTERFLTVRSMQNAGQSSSAQSIGGDRTQRKIEQPVTLLASGKRWASAADGQAPRFPTRIDLPVGRQQACEAWQNANGVASLCVACPSFPCSGQRDWLIGLSLSSIAADALR